MVLLQILVVLGDSHRRHVGRGAFGRLLHASLFLYQKLRTLVPTELEVTMKDPLSKLVPVPFYVLPYKANC